MLWCLISDAKAALDTTLDQFSSEFGYEDPDHALKTYKQCTAIAKGLNKLGIADYLDELSELYQDY